MLELKKGTKLKNYRNEIEATLDSEEYKGKFFINARFAADGGYTALCGTQRLMDLSGGFGTGGVEKKDGTKIDLSNYQNFAETEKFKVWLQKNKYLPQIRDMVFEVIKDYCLTYGKSHHWMFGGRVNLGLKQYTDQLGVYCGSFAGWLAKNKIGTITASHVHQNPLHRSKNDFSMQQFFVWSPPDSLVLKSNEVFCGISENEEQIARSRKEFKAYGFRENTSLLKPRYAKTVKDEVFDLFEAHEDEKAA